MAHKDELERVHTALPDPARLLVIPFAERKRPIKPSEVLFPGANPLDAAPPCVKYMAGFLSSSLTEDGQKFGPPGWCKASHG